MCDFINEYRQMPNRLHKSNLFEMICMNWRKKTIVCLKKRGDGVHFARHMAYH